jgi:hypothetical protein
MSEAATTRRGAPAQATEEGQRRDLARRRSEAYWVRRRHAAVLVTIELEPRDLAALEPLALLDPATATLSARQSPIRRRGRGRREVGARRDPVRGLRDPQLTTPEELLGCI